jgi:hypothetical protein
MRTPALLPATLFLTTILGCQAVSSGASKPPDLLVGDVSGLLVKSEYGFTYTGRVAVTSPDTSGMYLLALQLWYINRIDPAKEPDTTFFTGVMEHGRLKVDLSDYAGRCTTYTTTSCVRDGKEPKFGVRIVGWSPLQRPTQH